MLAEDLEPSSHAIDLVGVLALSVAFVNKPLRPLSISGGDLLNARHWICLVVSQERSVERFVLVLVLGWIKLEVAGLSSVAGSSAGSKVGIWVWPAVRKLRRIKKATIGAVKCPLHSRCVFLEFGNPAKNFGQFSADFNLVGRIQRLNKFELRDYLLRLGKSERLSLSHSSENWLSRLSR